MKVAGSVPGAQLYAAKAPPRVTASLRALGTSIRNVKGIGPKRATQLESFGIQTVWDLLRHLPFRYEDRRQIEKISSARAGVEATFVGRLIALQKRYIPRRRSQMLLATLRDDSASIDLVWYRAPGYLADNLTNGRTISAHGKVEPGIPGRLRIVHPNFDFIESEQDAEVGRIVPIYVHPTGVPLSLMRRWIAQALSEYGVYLIDSLPQSMTERHELMTLAAAITELHAPPCEIDVDTFNSFSSRAHRTVVFEELFYLQLGLGERKRSRSQSASIRFSADRARLSQRMRDRLRFDLTGAQRRALTEIEADMAQPQPMQRLLQGDVGSGKTIVAWFASLRAIEHGYQAIWMAPTEILAEQHYRNLKDFADQLRIPSALLTAATPPKEKKALLEAIARSDVAFVVGTHAVIQQEVRAPHMGLGVIDEQHRFGVMQRLSLQRLVEKTEVPSASNRQPHLLLMSATPIPRSLAMVLYGDMEVSFIDELPPGRRPVQTQVFAECDRKEVYSLVLDQLRQGRQAFVVLPLVEPSEQLAQVRDATQMAQKMQQTMFRQFGIGLVHGRLKSAERDRIMRSFRDGALSLLVATTVIEVGIDIPNATVMVVEHAERFGLSQLHQLRGRVGRGAAQSFCLLVNRGTGSALAAERLRVMEKEHDGFKIADADLRLRGPGELLGARQSGLADFHFANLTRDARLLTEARREALGWLEKDPELKSKASAGMRQILRHRWGAALEFGSVG
jgi:ATP-dependent DNA helicase RecG